MRKLALSLILGTVALLGATACGPAESAAGLVASAEAEALAAMGIQPEDLVAAETALDPTPTAGPNKERPKGDGTRLDAWRKRHAAKVMLHRNVLHGEAVVQKKDGTVVTVVVQRGEVTAISADSVTVKSADGFTQTWKFHTELRVVEKRATIQPSEVKVGAQIALAGPKEGDQAMARLIVIPMAK